MKKLFLLMLAFMFAMLIVSCGDDKEDPVDNEPEVDDTVTPDDATTLTDETVTEEEPDTDGTEPVACKLEDTFFDAQPEEWTAYFTMKMSGLINDAANEDPDFAFLTKINATLKGTAYNLGNNYGMYMLDSVQDVEGNTFPAVLAVGVGNLTWPVANKLAALWAGQTFVVVDDLMNWKEQAELEGYTGVSIDGTTQVAVFEVWIEVTSTAQYTRMECMRGLSKLNAEETAFEGAMFVCVDTNTEWAIGEQMKMMQYSNMVDDETEILALLNEGLETSDPNYRTDVCRCFTQDGATVIDCEDMKDEFGVGELPDEEETDNEVTDNEVTDELLTDN